MEAGWPSLAIKRGGTVAVKNRIGRVETRDDSLPVVLESISHDRKAAPASLASAFLTGQALSQVLYFSLQMLQ